MFFSGAQVVGASHVKESPIETLPFDVLMVFAWVFQLLHRQVVAKCASEHRKLKRTDFFQRKKLVTRKLLHFDALSTFKILDFSGEELDAFKTNLSTTDVIDHNGAHIRIV